MVFYPAVTTESSNTTVGGHLPQTSGFRSAKQILVVSFATHARAFILSDRNIFYTRGNGEQRRGLLSLGLFWFPVVFSGVFYPAVTTGSSNTTVGGHLPQTSGFRSAKQILVVSFATHARAFILSDRNIFYTRRNGEQRRGLLPLGLFWFAVVFSGVFTLPSGRGLVQHPFFFSLLLFSVFTPPSGRGLVIPIFFRVFFGGHLPQTSGLRSAKQILVVSFATQARAFILSDRNIFYTRGGGGWNNGGV